MSKRIVATTITHYRWREIPLQLFHFWNFLGSLHTNISKNYIANIVKILLTEIFWGKNFKFDEIKSFDFANNHLTISKFNGEKKIFNLNDIEYESVKKLENILKTNL